MKNMISATFIALMLGAVLTIAAVAQQPRVINGGVLNGKAVSLPKPVYPEHLKTAKIAGAVSVNVVIDENGHVIFAEAEMNDARSGSDASSEPTSVDPGLREAAESAARQARFSRTLLNGEPVHVKGKLLYSFTADGNAVPAISTAPSSEPTRSSSPPVSSQVKNINGGVLNSKAASLPLPGYPPAARAVRAQGSVSVQVLVDKAGSVISANAVSGHPLLRSSAEKAALEARFSPTMLNGQAVKISGILTYNFVAPKAEDQ
jgi:TonB family protein